MRKLPFFTHRFARILPLKTLLFISLLFSSHYAFSGEMTEGQQQLAQDIDTYQKIRSQSAESQNVNQQVARNDTKVVTPSKSGSQNQTQDQKIQELENKLNSVSQELQQLKSQGIPDERLKSIEEKLSVLAEEIDNIKQASVSPEPTYEQVYGGGPAASKVYLSNKGLSIEGYGELLVGQVVENGNNTVDTQRVVLYFGYKFTDRIIFNSEIEFEHATTEENVNGSEGEAGVEFALLDFLLIP